MNAVLIVVSAVVCLFGGTLANDLPVKVVFSGSKSSFGPTGLFGCKPRSTSSLPGPKALIRYQAVRTDGVVYSRVLVPSERMTFSDVVATNSSSPNLPECAKTAKAKLWDIFSFVNSQCVGYKIGDGICPCTKGDFVLYITKAAIRSRSSSRALTVAKERATAAPLPAGYSRKIIYPTVSMTGENFKSSSSKCEDILTQEGHPKLPVLFHNVNGTCYKTPAFSKYPCNSCPGTATEVIVKEHNDTDTYLLSKCGGTITAQLYTQADYNIKSYEYIYSHEGYGCIPYPDPASDAICDITVLGPAGTSAMVIGAIAIDTDESAGTACDGDELYVYAGPADGSPCTKKSTLRFGMTKGTNKVTIRFQRKPAYNRNSVNMGFALFVYSVNY